MQQTTFVLLGCICEEPVYHGSVHFRCNGLFIQQIRATTNCYFWLIHSLFDL